MPDSRRRFFDWFVAGLFVVLGWNPHARVDAAFHVVPRFVLGHLGYDLLQHLRILRFEAFLQRLLTDKVDRRKKKKQLLGKQVHQ